MKKILTVTALALTATIVQAAAIKWESGAITMADGSTKAGEGDVTAYLFAITADKYTSYQALSASALSSQLYADYGASLGSAVATADSMAKGNKANLVDPVAYSEGNSTWAAILYLDHEEDQSVMGNIGTYTFESGYDKSILNMASYIGGGTSGTATKWEAVPEPFSGTLALLGLSAIALRRKLKKQKKA